MFCHFYPMMQVAKTGCTHCASERPSHCILQRRLSQSPDATNQDTCLESNVLREFLLPWNLGTGRLCKYGMMASTEAAPELPCLGSSWDRTPTREGCRVSGPLLGGMVLVRPIDGAQVLI